MSDADWAVELAGRQAVIDAYMANDSWAVKIKKNVGVLLTSSSYGRAYLKSSLETHKQLGYWIAVAYDNFIDPNLTGPIDWNYWMPSKECMDMIDTLLIPHHQCWGGVSYPYIWQLRLASGLMSNFEYVFCNNGDCIIEKPEGFPKLIEAMGDADLISAGPTLEREIGTASFLVKGKIFQKIAKHMNDHMVPFEEYEKSTQDFGNTEGRLAVAVRELGLKTVIVDTGSCPHHTQCEQFHVPGKGFWYDTIGFRHLHGELNYAYRYKGIPPPSRYLDQMFTGSEDWNAITTWEKTGDNKVLENWYAKE